jgi:hypothetical protein
MRNLISNSYTTHQVDAGSDKKQQVYEGMSVEASGRKFLDSLATKIATLYTFDWGTILQSGMCFTLRKIILGNIFTGCEQELKEKWRIHLVFLRLSPLGMVKKCKVSLPDLFTTEEWERLKHYNRKIHDANLPRTKCGKAYLVLPHEAISQETAMSFKTIAVKGHLLKSNESLEIKYQDNRP